MTCIIEKNRVAPCSDLSDCSNGNSTENESGIVEHVMKNILTGQRRSFFSVKSGMFKDAGFALRFCPFCGVDISDPFDKKEAQNASL